MCDNRLFLLHVAVTWGNSGHFRAKPHQLMVMQVWGSDIIMHEGTFLSLLTNAKAPVFVPCVMPSSCAFSGAMSPFVMMLSVDLILDSPEQFVQKRARSPPRRRRCGRLRTLTGPARSLGPGRRAAGRAESRVGVTAPSTLGAMMPQ